MTTDLAKLLKSTPVGGMTPVTGSPGGALLGNAAPGVPTLSGLIAVPADRVQERKERILVYGVGGEGKTRFVTSLPEVFGEIVYIALDEGNENLDSVLPQYRSRIHVVTPKWENPLAEAEEISKTNWKAHYPEAKTIIVDTFSSWAWRALQYITDNGMFSEKRVKIGNVALPDVGEYGGTQAQIRTFISNIMRFQRDMHIIIVCHSDPPEAKRGAGGPSTVGKKMTEWLPARFKTVIRLDREVTNDIVKGAVVQTSRFVARSAPHGEWIARINENSSTGNPMPTVLLNVDPRNYWDDYLVKVVQVAVNQKEEKNVGQ